MLFILLILIPALICGILIVVLRQIMKRHIGTVSSQLESLTQEYNQKLADAKKRMDEANTYYEATTAKSKEDGERLRQQFIDEGFKEKQQMLDQARAQSEEITQRAHAAGEVLLQEINQKIDQAARDKAIHVIQTLLSGKMSEETHSYWVNELVKGGFDGLSRLNVPDHVKEADVTSAFPLKPAEKTILMEQLKQKLGRSVEIEESVDPKLILGLRVKIGSVLIDGSFDYRIREALSHGPSAND